MSAAPRREPHFENHLKADDDDDDDDDDEDDGVLPHPQEMGTTEGELMAVLGPLGASSEPS